MFFVPIAVVYYTYKGKTYESTVNMHNGNGHFIYPVSQQIEVKAKKTWKASIAMRTAGIVLSGAGCIVAFTKSIWAVLFAVGLFIILCVTAKKMKHDKSYFMNEYGSKGERLGANPLTSEIIHLVLSVVFSVLIMIIF